MSSACNRYSHLASKSNTLSCITPYHKPYDPDDPEQSHLATTMRLHKDDLVWGVVSVFMDNCKELLPTLDLLLQATNSQRLRATIQRLPIPAPTGQLELLKAVESLYANCNGNQAELDAVRGAVFESIALELVYRRFNVEAGGAFCSHNVRVGLKDGAREWVTSRTVDVAAWDVTGHNSEFYECKIQVFDIEAKHLSPINRACSLFLSAEPPRSSLAAVCTLTSREDFEFLLEASVSDGGKQEIIARYPHVRFFNLSEVIAMG